MSELLDVRVIGAPEVAAQAVARLEDVLELDRVSGPYPSRKSAGLVRYYLTGRLRPATAAPAVAFDRAAGGPAAARRERDR